MVEEPETKLVSVLYKALKSLNKRARELESFFLYVCGKRVFTAFSIT